MASSRRSRTESEPPSQSTSPSTLTPSTQLVSFLTHPLPNLPIYILLTIRTVAPATGTPETGGWSTRELRTIIRGLEGINLIAADIVEVAPAYDTNAEHTTMAAADALYEIMSLMVKKGPLSKMVDAEEIRKTEV
jgi:agmatinase